MRCVANKFCFKCTQAVPMDVFVCPQCSAESFLHHDPNKPLPSSDSEEPSRSNGNLRSVSQSRVAPPPPKEIDPEKLELFKARFAKELEELEYLEWRSHQPGWKSDEVQQRIKHISATAAGVAIGTSILRSQLGSIQDAMSSDSGGDSSSWLGDLFS